MTKLFIGVDSTGVPCVKITKGNLNPYSEPDANYGSFFYNSKWSKDVKLGGINVLPTPTGDAKYPSGSSAWTYGHYVSFNQNYQVYRRAYFTSVYDFPAYDVKWKDKATGRFKELNRRRFQGASQNGSEAAYVRTEVPGVWYADLNNVGGAGTTMANFFGYVGSALMVYGHWSTTDNHVILWELPANNEAIRDSAPKTPIAGQRVVEIKSNVLRVAKPGFDVRTATPTQMALDGSRRPASIIKSGDIALPVGVTEYPLGFAVNANTACDIILYNGGVITFPMGQYFDALEVEYWFSGSSLFINNVGTACRARFIVMAFDTLGPTNGTNKPLNRTTVNGQNVIQLLRPGAADPPRVRDIILDSRWPSLQILDEGWIDVAQVPDGMYYPGSQIQGQLNQGQAVTKTFNNAGLFPFVKYWTYNYHAQFGWTIKPALTFITESWNNKTRYHQGNSSYCALTNNQATFVTFNGNPVLERTAGGNQWVYDYAPDPISGIRYFIFGIPTT